MKHVFETYETDVSRHLDNFLEEAYTRGFILVDGIKIINDTFYQDEIMPDTANIISKYSVTVHKMVEDNSSERGIYRTEANNPKFTPTGALAPEEVKTATVYCTTCGSDDIRARELVLEDAVFGEAYCHSCGSKELAGWKEWDPDAE